MIPEIFKKMSAAACVVHVRTISPNDTAIYVHVFIQVNLPQPFQSLCQ